MFFIFCGEPNIFLVIRGDERNISSVICDNFRDFFVIGGGLRSRLPSVDCCDVEDDDASGCTHDSCDGCCDVNNDDDCCSGSNNDCGSVDGADDDDCVGDSGDDCVADSGDGGGAAANAVLKLFINGCILSFDVIAELLQLRLRGGVCIYNK